MPDDVSTARAADDPDDLSAVALLAEPVRRRLYDLIRARGVPVGREEAAAAVAVSVKLAAFHLDRLAEAGLLDVTYRRLTGRAGPGAGRPSKLYEPSSRRISISVPPTNYELASRLMAAALTGHEGVSGPAAVARAATSYGRHLGTAIRAQFRSKQARREALVAQLAELGFEPHQETRDRVVLRNCAFADLSRSHRDLVCGMNAALVAGAIEGAELASLRAVGGPSETTCCVRVIGR